MEEYYKQVRIKMIEKDATWDQIAQKSELYKTNQGIRYALKHGNKKAYEECLKILDKFFPENVIQFVF